MPMVSKVLEVLERFGAVPLADSKKSGAKTRGSQSTFQPLPNHRRLAEATKYGIHHYINTWLRQHKHGFLSRNIS